MFKSRKIIQQVYFKSKRNANVKILAVNRTVPTVSATTLVFSILVNYYNLKPIFSLHEDYI